VREGESVQREEEDEATMSDLEKGGREMDLRSRKRNHVEDEAISRGSGINREKMKSLSLESQLLEKKSLAGDGKVP